MASRDDFIAFYTAFNTAIQGGDQAALRQVLPPGIPEDHFAFLWQMNQALAAETATPEITVEGDYATVTYVQTDGDDEDVMTREFWFHDGKWISYDPSEED